MNFLFASDSFKGTLSSEKIIELLTVEAKKVFPDCTTKGVLIADGGEGTVDTVIKNTKGKIIKLDVYGPLMEKCDSYYGEINKDSAIIEMAAASGLPMVPIEKRNPLNTSTYGTGELIKATLDKGFHDITIAIGGSATNDGGMGAMIALGIKFLDANGNELKGTGSDLEKVHDIDLSKIHPSITKTKFTVMCDVNNPLTGERGATYTFGKQKGGTPEILDRLEKGMKNYAKVLLEKTGVDVDKIAGSGAAGGLGAALCIFLNATLKSGIETVLDLIEFDSLLKDIDLVITGEGRIDWQSAFGKVPSGIGNRCKTKNIPVIAIVGGMGDGAQDIYEHGVESIITTVNCDMELNEALNRAEELYIDASGRTFRLLKVGMTIKK
ncbi:MAG: glycerate kinase [Fusobacteriaceae bacterium]|nr:glycerate kinase [Fusobacteriaceae bacterium]